MKFGSGYWQPRAGQILTSAKRDRENCSSAKGERAKKSGVRKLNLWFLETVIRCVVVKHPTLFVRSEMFRYLTDRSVQGVEATIQSFAQRLPKRWELKNSVFCYVTGPTMPLNVLGDPNFACNYSWNGSFRIRRRNKRCIARWKSVIQRQWKCYLLLPP